MPTPDELLDTAHQMARAAGQVLRDCFRQKRTITFKGASDIVTDADTAAEAAGLAVLRARFPDHAVLAEEGGESGGAAPFRWYFDPLDGTTNYAHGVPHFCVSVGCEEHGAGMVAGVVLDPLRGEVFAARKGGGATLDGEPIHVSAEGDLGRSVLTTGFPYDLKRRPDELLALFAGFTKRAFATRRLGSAALDLAYVAAGRFDGFWESGLSPWDVAAGMLLVTEAGGRVTAYRGQEARVDGREIVAANPALLPEMLALIAEIEGR